MAKVGVILSGCGVQDGSEIHEAVLTLLALDRAGAEAVVAAPDRDQAEVVDHRTGKKSRSRRNVLTESARISRGEIIDVAELKADDLDALVLPGGYGAAKNLSTFAADGADCTVDEDVTKLVKAMHKAGKPIAALCVAPAILARVLGKKAAPDLTLGNDPDAAAALEKMGAKHHETSATQVLVDDTNRIVTTPCYMLDSRIGEVATGIEKAVGTLLRLAEKTEAVPA
jgi:enhancing lycopene biosynthesis protein 2